MGYEVEHPGRGFTESGDEGSEFDDEDTEEGRRLRESSLKVRGRAGV